MCVYLDVCIPSCVYTCIIISCIIGPMTPEQYLWPQYAKRAFHLPTLPMIDLLWSRLKLSLNDPWTICEAFFHLLPSALLAFIILYQQSIAHVHSALNYMKKCTQRTSKCSIRTIKADVAEWVLKKQTNDQIHPLSHFSRGQFKSRTNKLGFPVQ